jgi:hypothetical protein
MISLGTKRLNCFALTFALVGLLSSFASTNNGPPKITSFSPAQGAVGTSVEIRGTDLNEVASVQFNGVSASFSILADLVLASVPANATTGPISVTTAQGKDTTLTAFTVTAAAAPKITGFSPAQGTVGTSVEIRGTNLNAVTAVQFNGVTASFSILSDLVLASVPAGATTGPISVTTAQGTDTTLTVFTVTATAAPVVTGFSPKTGEPGATVEIQGTNLAGATTVRFNGAEASFRILAGSLSATVPANATTGPITVMTPSGTFVTTEMFTVTRLAGPIITAFSPTSGAAGSSVQISGTNLVGVTAVKFNGADASFFSSGSSLNAIVPSTATTGPITVITGSGTNTTAAQFTVTLGPPPVISDFTPESGEPGVSVDIRGLYLRDVIAVRFNGVNAVFTNYLFRPLSAFVPTNATTGPITVVTASGSFTTSNQFSVIRLLPPVISSISPLSGPTGSVIEILGTNLLNVTEVKIKEVPAPFIEFSSVRLRVLVPPNAVSGLVTVTTRGGTTISTESFQVTNATPPAAVPLLSFRVLSQSRIELSWSADATDFALQFSDSLQSPIRWTNANAPVELNAGRRIVTLDLAGGQRFYRLAHP